MLWHKNFYKIKNTKNLDLSKVHFVLMRQNPPFNMDYITATYLLQKLPKTTKVLNNHFAVRNIPEKLSSIYFTKLMPPSLFAKDINEILKFKKKYKKIIIKPTHGYGGNNILFVTHLWPYANVHIDANNAGTWIFVFSFCLQFEFSQK